TLGRLAAHRQWRAGRADDGDGLVTPETRREGREAAWGVPDYPPGRCRALSADERARWTVVTPGSVRVQSSEGMDGVAAIVWPVRPVNFVVGPVPAVFQYPLPICQPNLLSRCPGSSYLDAPVPGLELEVGYDLTAAPGPHTEG